jgi:serine/threonine protein kinase
MSLADRAIGRYRIIEKLGEGGMGVVYRAQDTTLGRNVAIKVLRPDLGRHPDRVRRFSHEARAASALNHPNIITVHDAGEFEDGPFLVMELVEGESLRAQIRRGPLPMGRVLDIGIQAAAALSRTHESGITHRDLKPENIMVRVDGYVKILDFGLAKLKEKDLPVNASAASTLTAAITSEGSIVGTAAYMSPEQAASRPVDGRSDIFSLALVLLESWQGRNPFLRANLVDTLHAIVHDHRL